MTASDLMARLENDPEWVKQRNERERIHAEKVALNLAAEKPLVDALRDVGLNIGSLNDLIQLEKPYPEAIPVLMEYMDREHSDHVRGCIALALAVPEAIGEWRKIKTAFLNDPNPTTDFSRTKWQWALALAASADDSVLGEVIELILDKNTGRDRAPLLQALLRSKDPRARAVLKELEKDPVIGADAKKALKKGRWP
ncbi:MAG: hypothetical protein IPL96_12425 [Holophagaceae bacterium]|nr:hypothetical protein [Holophagaceae bacterium]